MTDEGGVADRARAAAQRAAGRLGFTVLRRGYYSPVPDLEALPSDHFERPSALHGIEFDVAAQLAFLRDELAPHVREWSPPREPTGGPGRFHLGNTMYGPVDAEVLYAMLRHRRPRRVVELGSGDSSLAIAEALAANRVDGVDADYRAFDPFPRPELSGVLREVAQLTPVGATDVPLERFSELEAGDVLFVDTTHTVKAGGDVNHIVFEVLPQVRPGVIVHFHDVFLPWEYPRDWLERQGRYWCEQYLLQAFLMFNDEWRVVFGANAVAQEFPAELGEVVPSFHSGVEPGALWIERVA